MNWMRAFTLVLACCLPGLPAQAAEMPWPGDSLYRLDAKLDAAGRGTLALHDLAGRPVLVTMFYGRCTVVCPALTLAMQRVEAALPPAVRGRVQFVMVSFDSEHDTPEVLAGFAAEHHLDPGRWTIAHASSRDVRLLAAALRIRYRQLPDGSFSHSSVLTVLDPAGVPAARSEVLAEADPRILDALQAGAQ